MVNKKRHGNKDKELGGGKGQAWEGGGKGKAWEGGGKGNGSG
jgi:hypothetical protein